MSTMIAPEGHASAVRQARDHLAGQRASTDRMLWLSRFLGPHDHQLIQAIYERGFSLNQVARLGDRSPRVVQARVRRLVSRMGEWSFRWVAEQLECWGAVRADVARLCVLRGLSLRDTAELTGYSLHEVRSELAAIRALVQHAKERRQR